MPTNRNEVPTTGNCFVKRAVYDPVTGEIDHYEMVPLADATSDPVEIRDMLTRAEGAPPARPAPRRQAARTGNDVDEAGASRRQ